MKSLPINFTVGLVSIFASASPSASADQPGLACRCDNGSNSVSGRVHFIKLEGTKLVAFRLLNGQGDLQEVAVLRGDCIIEPVMESTLVD